MLNKVLNNKIISGMFFVTLGSIISTFLSYYFNFYVQSLFPDLSDYSNYVFIVTFLSISILAPSAVGSSLSLLVTELNVKNETKKLTKLYLNMNLVFGVIGLLFLAICLILNKEISSVFKIDNPFYVQLLGLLLFLSALSIPLVSFLQGLLRFKSLSSLIIFLAFIKIVIVYILFHLDFGFLSVPYGLLIGACLQLLVGNLLLISSFDSDFSSADVKGFTKKVLLISLPLFFITTGTGLLTQVDFLVIKSKFLPEVSGEYALLINIGKIFFFGSYIFLGAMGPQVTEAFNKKDGYFKILFFYSKIIGVIISLGISVFVFFPKQFLDLFIFLSGFIGLNSKSLALYYGVTDLIPAYSIFISLAIVINLLVIFLIATTTTRIYLAFIFSLLLQFILINFLATDLYSCIFYNIIAASSLLIYLCYETYKKYESIHNSSSI